MKDNKSKVRKVNDIAINLTLSNLFIYNILADGPWFAEVLYQFQSGGPQELPLEKGALVEILRRESGPWWWGQVVYDSILSNTTALEGQQGWFPKDFVKIIPSFSRPRAQLTNSNKKCDISQIKASLPPPSSIPVVASQCLVPNRDTLRDNVIKELLETELNYVKLLGSLCLG